MISRITNIINFVTANTDSKCLPGWFSYEGHCYKFDSKKNRQNQAENQCAKYGAVPVVISDVNELEWVIKIIKTVARKYIAILMKF